MRKKHVAVAAVGAVLVAVLAIRLWPRGQESDRKAGAVGPERSVARARAARKGGQVDLRPADVGGRVVDQDGKPIAGAVVSVAMRNLSRGERSDPGASPEPLTDVSDEEGRWSAGALRPGRYSVSAAAAGHLPVVVEPLILAPGERRDDVTLTLSRGGHVLVGTVSDIGGGPIAGALVRATGVGDGNVFHLFRAPFAAMTGADGRYQLTLPDGSYLVEAIHIDYVSESSATEIRGADRTENFALTPGAVVSGVVRMRSTDEPVAGATVTRSGGSGKGDGGGLDLGGMGLSGAQTGADGAFTLRGVPAGSAAVSAFGPGYASRQPTEIQVGIGEEVSGVVVYVDRAYSIRGFVVDKRNKDHGIDGVLVGAWNFSGKAHLARDSSAEDGFFEIHGVQNGTYLVAAAGEERVVSLMSQNVTVADADVEDVIVELDAGATLSGRVEPPSAARIGFDVDPETIGLGNITQVVGAMAATVRASADGTFTLRGVPDGSFTLVAHSDDGGEGRLPVVVAGADQSSLLIKVDARSSISGVVVDATGKPVEGLKVEPSMKGGERGILDGLSELWGRGHGVTAGDGSFQVRGLAPGLYRVRVSDDKGALAWADDEHKKKPHEPIEVTIEGTTPVTGLRLVVEARNSVIRGIVLGPDGAPVADAWVTARRSMEAEAVAEAVAPAGEAGGDGEGGGGGDGSGGRRQRSVSITIGGDGSSVDSESGTEKELAEAERRRMRRFGPAENPVLTGADGRFEIRGLRETSYDLEAEGLKGTAYGAAESIKAGATNATVRMQTLAGVTGRVTIAGKPVTTYTVTGKGPMTRSATVLDPDGTYRLSRLEPGTYKVSVIAPEGSTSGTVKVAANQVARRDLTLIPYASVHGVVVDARTGKPMVGMPVVAFSDDGGDMGALAMKVLTGDGPKTDTEGRFRVGHLGSGKGNLLVLDGDKTNFSFVARKDFNLAPGQDLDLGTIQGEASEGVPKEERGDVGMDVVAAPFAARPRPPGAKDTAKPPAGDTADSQYLWVSSVEEKGPAAAAGAKVGDRVLSINGLDVAAIGADMAEDMLSPRRVRVGQPVALVLERDGKSNSVSVTPRKAATP